MMFVLHVQSYAPHVVPRSEDSESISHMPDFGLNKVSG